MITSVVQYTRIHIFFSSAVKMSQNIFLIGIGLPGSEPNGNCPVRDPNNFYVPPGHYRTAELMKPNGRCKKNEQKLALLIHQRAGAQRDICQRGANFAKQILCEICHLISSFCFQKSYHTHQQKILYCQIGHVRSKILTPSSVSVALNQQGAELTALFQSAKAACIKWNVWSIIYNSIIPTKQVFIRVC